MEYNVTPEQLEKIKDAARKDGVIFSEMINAIYRAVHPLFSSYDLQEIIRKRKRREKYLRRYARIGKQMRKSGRHK